MATVNPRRAALLELADDLMRWAQACRDEYSDLYDLALAHALEQLAARCREMAP